MKNKRRTTNAPAPAPSLEPVKSAREAGLHYVTREGPGIRRRNTTSGFEYIGVNGSLIRDHKMLERIRSLVIPPAWTDVWICPLANGHLQAVGRDARGRKQYRYHPRYREMRDRNKFNHVLAFGSMLPAIRKRLWGDLKAHGLPRSKVLATVVRLLDLTSIRVGNQEYAKENNSFGLTTLRNGHVHIKGPTLRFQFRGKSGQMQDIGLKDSQLAHIVKRCREIPGQDLFEYLTDDGQPMTVHSEDVNEYLREISGQNFTAKDFRTWSGTTLAALELEQMGATSSVAEVKRNVVAAIKTVSQKLGNHPPACRKYYVHPAVLESYSAGQLFEIMKQPVKRRSPHALRREEVAVINLLEASSRNSPHQNRAA